MYKLDGKGVNRNKNFEVSKIVHVRSIGCLN